MNDSINITYTPVAPLTGAWIETYREGMKISGGESRPSRARGLKQRMGRLSCSRQESRPSRARGLKQRMGRLSCSRQESRPSRARGLKQVVSG